MNSLDSAFNLADDLRSRAAFSKEPASGMLTGTGGYGFDHGASKLSSNREQYAHFKNWSYTAIKTIAQRIAGQDIFVGRVRTQPTRHKLALPNCLKGVGTKLEPVQSHPLLEALNDPNPLQVRWSLVYATVAGLLLTGRAHWLLIAGEGGKLQLWPIPAHWLKAADPLRGSWLLRADGSTTEVEISNDDIATFMLPDPSSPMGCVSPLQTQSTAVATDEHIQTAQLSAFRNGINPGLIIRAGRVSGMNGEGGERPVLTDDQRTELVESIQKLHRGARRYGDPLIVDGLIEGIEKFTHSVSEMDFMQSSESVKSRIMQSFGVNPIVSGQVQDANRASAAVAGELFAQNTCNPLVELLSQTLTQWVARRFGSALVCWIDPCRSNDPEQRLAEWRAAAALGYVTPNEFRREILNLPDIDGGDVRTDSLGNPIESEAPAKLPDFSRNGHARH